MPLFVLSRLLSSLWVSRTGSASDWCELQEALHKCIDTIQYNTTIHTDTHIHTQTHTHTRTHTHPHKHTHAHARTHTHTDIYIYTLYIYKRIMISVTVPR